MQFSSITEFLRDRVGCSRFISSVQTEEWNQIFHRTHCKKANKHIPQNVER